MDIKDFKKLNNFFWFFSLDLKSSKKTTQSILSNWIDNNKKYNEKSWEINLTSKRIISWLSNHQLTYKIVKKNTDKNLILSLKNRPII